MPHRNVISGFGKEDVLNFLRSGRQSKKTSMRDEIRRDGNVVKVKLWQTDIAEINPATHKMKIQSGGWQTDLTKRRLIQLGADIRQKKGKWLLGDKDFVEGAEVDF